MILVDGGKALRQPVVDLDIATAIERILQTPESKGQIYELGGPSQYTLKELFEFMGNNLNHRPYFIDYSYDELMRMYLSPNTNWEKAAHYLIIRPDYLTRARQDNIITDKEGIKTFKDLDIMPLSTHHHIRTTCNYLLEKLNLQNITAKGWDEIDADD